MKTKMSKILMMVCLVAFFSYCDEETPSAPTLTVSVEEILLGNTGLNDADAPAEFEVTSSSAWTLTCTSWLTPSVTSGESGTSTISVTASRTTEERVGYITVVNSKSAAVKSIITVTQVAEDLVASTLTIEPMAISVDFQGKKDGGVPTIQITTNRDYTITALPDWITVTPASGTAGTDISVTLTIAVNDQRERVGKFAVEAGTRKDSVTVTQAAEAQNLTVDLTTIEVSGDGKTTTGKINPVIKITTNKDWTITALPDWITATPASGTAGTDIPVTLTVAKNDGAARTEYIRVSAGYLSEIITINQLKDDNFKTEFPVIVGKGTIQPKVGVTITEYPTYWKIESDGVAEIPAFPLALEEALPELASCSFNFEYQVSMNLPGMWCFFNKAEYLVGHEIAGIALTATAGGVDPDNEALWTLSTTNVWWFTTIFGWGVDYTEMGFWLREKTACTLLLRKMKLVRNP